MWNFVYAWHKEDRRLVVDLSRCLGVTMNV